MHLYVLREGQNIKFKMSNESWSFEFFNLIYPVARKKANTAVLTLGTGVRSFQYTITMSFFTDVMPRFMLTISALCHLSPLGSLQCSIIIFFQYTLLISTS